MTLTRTRRVLTAAIAGALFALSPLAGAHDAATLDKMKSPNGGQMRDAGPLHLELVVVRNSKDVRDNLVIVYVTDNANQKVSTAGATANVTLMSGATTTTVPLVPDGDNRLKASARYASTADLKAIVSVTLAGKPPELWAPA